jgi:nitroreductase
MKSLHSETLLRQLQWRYAVKKFDPTRKISPVDWKALEQTLGLAPSSFGLQPWKFFVVGDPEVRAKLLPFTWGQMQVVDASHLVVFAIKKDFGLEDVERHVERTAEVRGVPVEALAGFRKMMVGSLVPPPAGFDLTSWATNQVYLALGFFMTAAAVLGIDTCPMEGFQPANYDELLGLPAQGYASSVLCAAGYRAADDKAARIPKVRFRTEDVVTPV